MVNSLSLWNLLSEHRNALLLVPSKRFKLFGNRIPRTEGVGKASADLKKIGYLNDFVK